MRSQNALHTLVEEIAEGLFQEIKSRSLDDVPGEAAVSDEPVSTVVDEVALEVTQNLPAPVPGSAAVGGSVQERLALLESRLEKLTKGARESSKGDSQAKLPNLKYAKSKYQNVESLLNYVETKDDEGGIKLVIMNFND